MSAQIHPTAIVSPDAKLADGVEIGAFSIVDAGASIGENTWIDSHVRIHGAATIGSECRIHQGAAIAHSSVDLKFEGGDCRAVIGDRNIIREYVTISASSFDGKATAIGNGNLLMHWTNIAHDCVIGDGVIMANFVTLGGHVEIEGPCRIGALAGFHQYVRVGRGSMIGGYSKVTQDAPPYSLTEGNPAWARSLNLIGRGVAKSHPMADVPEESISALKRAFRLIFRSDLKLADALDQAEEAAGEDPHAAHLIQFVRSSKRGVRRRASAE